MSADNSFDKSYRLLSASDFSYLKSDSQVFSTKFVRIYYKNSRLNESKSRLGIAVSKKFGNAVKRNFVKRRVREYFRNSLIKTLGKDILFVISPKLGAKHIDVSDSLSKSLHIINKHFS